MSVFKKSLSTSNKIDSVFDKDNPTNAEILWTLKVIIIFLFGLAWIWMSYSKPCFQTAR